MERDERIAQLEAEKADLQRQLARAQERIRELEEKLTAVEVGVLGQLEKAQSQIEELKGMVSKNSHNFPLLDLSEVL